MNIKQEQKDFEEWFLREIMITPQEEDRINKLFEVMPKSESGLDTMYADSFPQDYWVGWQARANNSMSHVSPSLIGQLNVVLHGFKREGRQVHAEVITRAIAALTK